MIENYTFIKTSEIPDKIGYIYPKNMVITLPNQINIYYGEVEPQNLVGYGISIKREGSCVSANLIINTKKFSKSKMKNHSACPLFNKIKIRVTDFGDEIVSCNLLALVLSTRPSIREIKRLIEK